jgi:hypothetical protein
VLRAPAEGELPKRGPKEFDVSARALPLPDQGVAVWRELGRWVFALSSGGKLLHAQATSCLATTPDAAVAAEIRLAMTQLALQGMPHELKDVVLWGDTADLMLGHVLNGAFRGQVQVLERPAPVLPEPRSRLLPEDVRAARRERARKQQRVAVIAAVVLIYAGLAGWLGYGLWQDMRDTKRLQAEADAVKPETVAYETHRAKWDQLAPLVDSSYWPVEVLFRVASQMPTSGAVRLKVAEVSARDIKLTGECAEPGPISQFSLAITRNDLLRAYKWETPPPEQTNKGMWNFSFNGVRQ